MVKVGMSFKFEPEIRELLDLLKEREGLNYTEVVENLIKRATSNALIPNDSDLDLDWLSSQCKVMIHLEDGYYCAFKIPKARPFKLGNGGIKDAEKICGACQWINNLVEEKEELSKIAKGEFTIELPYCNLGGVLQPDLKKIHCPITGGLKPVEFCTDKVGTECEHHRSVLAKTGVKPR